MTGRGVSVVKAGEGNDWHEWVRRVTGGDEGAEAELVRRYKDGIAIIIQRIVNNQSEAEDLSQETIRVVLEKVRKREVREPEKLSGFICGVARNLAIDSARKMRRAASQRDSSGAGLIRDPRPDQYEQLWRKEGAEMVRQTIDELKGERDREVLFRYYIAEEDKGRICGDLGLTSQQFNSVIFRALKLYKELYLKRFGEL